MLTPTDTYETQNIDILESTLLFIHMLVIRFCFTKGFEYFYHCGQVGMTGSQPTLCTLACQWSVSMHLFFFLETMKLTYFLLGSNSAREEIIATPCCVSLVCGEGKNRGACGDGSESSMLWSAGLRHSPRALFTWYESTQ